MVCGLRKGGRGGVYVLARRVYKRWLTRIQPRSKTPCTHLRSLEQTRSRYANNVGGSSETMKKRSREPAPSFMPDRSYSVVLYICMYGVFRLFVVRYKGQERIVAGEQESEVR